MCGPNTASIRVLTATMAARPQPGAPDRSTDTTGAAVTAMSTLTGASSTTVQVSKADAIWLVSVVSAWAVPALSPAAPIRGPTGPGQNAGQGGAQTHQYGFCCSQTSILHSRVPGQAPPVGVC